MSKKDKILIVLILLIFGTFSVFVYLIYQEKQTTKPIEKQELILKKETEESLTKKETEDQFTTLQGEILEINQNSLKVKIQKDFDEWISVVRITLETEIVITNLNRENSYLEVGDEITVLTKENNIIDNLDFQASKIIQNEDSQIEINNN